MQLPLLGAPSSSASLVTRWRLVSAPRGALLAQVRFSLTVVLVNMLAAGAAA